MYKYIYKLYIIIVKIYCFFILQKRIVYLFKNNELETLTCIDLQELYKIDHGSYLKIAVNVNKLVSLSGSGRGKNGHCVNCISLYLNFILNVGSCVVVRKEKNYR